MFKFIMQILTSVDQGMAAVSKSVSMQKELTTAFAEKDTLWDRITGHAMVSPSSRGYHLPFAICHLLLVTLLNCASLPFSFRYLGMFKSSFSMRSHMYRESGKL